MNTQVLDGLPKTVEEMRQRLHELSTEQKIYLAHKTLLPYSYYDQIFDAIDECRRITPFRDEPLCLFVSGEPNSGKTTIAREYAAKYPKEYLETKTHAPVLLVRVYSPPTSTTLCKQLLRAVSMTSDTRGPTNILTDDLVKLLVDGGTEVVLLDEVQGFHENKRVETNLILSSWIKDLSGNAHVTVVLMGMPKAETLFSLNEQLSRRFAHRIRIQPFRYDTAAAQKIFDELLADCEYAMPFDLPMHLNSPDIAARIFYASNGWIGFTSDLVRGAALIGLDRGEKRLSRDLLSESYEKNIKEHFTSKHNPFLRKSFSPEQACELITIEKKRLEDKQKVKK